MRRLVVDPNVLASGLADAGRGSPPKLLYDGVAEIAFEAAVCPRLLGEVRKALREPYFRERVEMAAVEEAPAVLGGAGVMLDDPVEVVEVLRDPRDDYLLVLAREAGAEAIVTGDKDLLDHAGELAPKVINAREACELLGLN